MVVPFFMDFYWKECLTNNGNSDLGLWQTFSKNEPSKPITSGKTTNTFATKMKKLQLSSEKPEFWNLYFSLYACQLPHS